eukprot:TRINITY_DN34772_c0_g1_i2.p1 TRINITY_DN34772_c0_g1~~TRINITY_DN34772_c0_g1_i2.p1  ORF type:complete len:673 (+),score=142.19 TRINITY_DN34772_c0_g1_i2:82-2019(+)
MGQLCGKPEKPKVGEPQRCRARGPVRRKVRGSVAVGRAAPSFAPTANPTPAPAFTPGEATSTPQQPVGVQDELESQLPASTAAVLAGVTAAVCTACSASAASTGDGAEQNASAAFDVLPQVQPSEPFQPPQASPCGTEEEERGAADSSSSKAQGVQLHTPVVDARRRPTQEAPQAVHFAAAAPLPEGRLDEQEPPDEALPPESCLAKDILDAPPPLPAALDISLATVRRVAPASAAARGGRRRSRSPRDQSASALPELPYGPEGFLRVSEDCLLTTTSGEQLHVCNFLGSGGFASVWRAAKRAGSGEPFALKICRTGAENTTDARKEADTLVRVHRSRALREFGKRVVTALMHFEVQGPHGPHVCIAMPVMGADLLAMRVAHGSRGTAPSIVKVLLKQLLQGIAFLAAAGFAHSDLKPANLLLGTRCQPGAPPGEDTPGGDELLRGAFAPPRPGESLESALLRQYELRIGDLGGCFHVQSWRPAHLLEQTTDYRAPEVVARAFSVSSAIGVWAAACVAYEILTGEVLFAPVLQQDGGETDREQFFLWYQTLGGPPPVYAVPAKFAHAKFLFVKKRLRYCPRMCGTPLWKRLPVRCAQHDLEMDQLVSFLLAMLEYVPEERATALVALQHPWLQLEAEPPPVAQSP